MAKVTWTTRAKVMRKKLYADGVRDFGPLTAKKTYLKTEAIADDLAKWPTSGHPEQLLLGRPLLYRAKPINDRFRIIYRYDEGNDIIYIEDIWDTRRNPVTLKQRIR
jgi:plasmid stabilization system protein ParE